VRIEGIALKDHGHVPVTGGKTVNGMTIKPDSAPILRYKACNNIEQGAFTAA